MPLHGRMSNSFWSNCLIALLCLIVKKKLKYLIFVSSNTIVFPWHFVGITNNGNGIHFRTLKTRDFLAPWLFKGRFEIIYKKDLLEVLKQEKRVIRRIIRVG